MRGAARFTWDIFVQAGDPDHGEPLKRGTTKVAFALRFFSNSCTADSSHHGHTTIGMPHPPCTRPSPIQSPLVL